MSERDRRLKLQKEAIEKIKTLLSTRSFNFFIQEELPRVSKNTLNALVNKDILVVKKGIFGEDGPDYYSWTGEELK